jgi:hypothetical protein
VLGAFALVACTPPETGGYLRRSHESADDDDDDVTARDGGAAPKTRTGSGSSSGSTSAEDDTSTDETHDVECVESLEADHDCAAATPRKLDCGSKEEQSAAIALGCVPERPDHPGDSDVCCPSDLRGKRPPRPAHPPVDGGVEAEEPETADGG